MGILAIEAGILTPPFGLLVYEEQVVDIAVRVAAFSAAEAERLGRLLGDARAVAYSAWVRARVAARRDDTAAVLRLLREAEASTGDWFEHHTGAEFLARFALLPIQYRAVAKP